MYGICCYSRRHCSYATQMKYNTTNYCEAGVNCLGDIQNGIYVSMATNWNILGNPQKCNCTRAQWSRKKAAAFHTVTLYGMTRCSEFRASKNNGNLMFVCPHNISNCAATQRSIDQKLTCTMGTIKLYGTLPLFGIILETNTKTYHET